MNTNLHPRAAGGPSLGSAPASNLPVRLLVGLVLAVAVVLAGFGLSQVLDDDPTTTAVVEGVDAGVANEPHADGLVRRGQIVDACQTLRAPDAVERCIADGAS